MTQKTIVECFINLKYRHIPIPNLRKEGSGLLVLQQQKLPGSTVQQAYPQVYLAISPPSTALWGYRGLTLAFLN